MIVTSKGLFPKQYKTGYKYCLMVNQHNKVTMIWNYTAREYMFIVDNNYQDLTGVYSADEIKKMWKNKDIKVIFIDNATEEVTNVTL